MFIIRLILVHIISIIHRFDNTYTTNTFSTVSIIHIVNSRGRGAAREDPRGSERLPRRGRLLFV